MSRNKGTPVSIAVCVSSEAYWILSGKENYLLSFIICVKYFAGIKFDDVNRYWTILHA